MLEQSITYPPQPGYPLYITAKRYWLPAFDACSKDPDALTLIFLHSTSFHKETWEPVMEQVFKLASQHGGPVKIREAWALDCPNHGESGQLNEIALQRLDFFREFTCEKYAYAVHHFLSAGPDRGARVDFRSRNLVGFGHSLGSVAMTILQCIQPLMPFKSIILVEPMLSADGPELFAGLRSALVKSAYERRDVWPNREQALATLKKRNRTSRWDPRVLDLFVKHALRPHPGSYDTQTPYNGVTLACTRDHEAAMYKDVDGPTKPLGDLNVACSRIPVHIIFGGINDFIERKIQNALIDPKSGRHFASITRVKGAGHLVPQEVPRKLGTEFYNALIANARHSSRSKL